MSAERLTSFGTKQHWYQAAGLARFVNPARMLWTYDKDTDTVSRVEDRSRCQRSGFSDLPSIPGEDELTLDDALTQTEQDLSVAVNALYSRLAHSGRQLLQEADPLQLAFGLHLAFAIKRSARLKRDYFRLASCECRSPECTTIAWIEMVAELASTLSLARTLEKKHWIFLVPGEQQRFWCSDTPIARWNPTVEPESYFDGWAWTGSIVYVPLTPTDCLGLFDRDVYSRLAGYDGGRMRVDDRTLREINALQFEGAIREVYSSRRDF